MEHTTLNTSSRHVTCVLLVTVSMLIVVDPLNKELESCMKDPWLSLPLPSPSVGVESFPVRLQVTNESGG